MNNDEQLHGTGRGGVGTDQPRDSKGALAELRAQLEAKRVAQKISKTQLAGRAGLSRTVVSQALSDAAPAPSAQTVGALARALALEVRPLLDLLATASGTAAETGGRLLGRPISDWAPLDLEVHPAVDVFSSSERGRSGRGRVAALPSYVRRPHDDVLAEVVAAAGDGTSEMAVLVGSSSTGKTRACWEAVQPLSPRGWRLWHPFDPYRAKAALTDIAHVAPHTVVWLNEAQHYLGAGEGVGELIAAALSSLLTDRKRGPVLILGTLWPEYAAVYNALPKPGIEDVHFQVRQLLAGRQVPLPDSFDDAATDITKKLADKGDRQLAHALEHVRGGRLTQFLAGAPELLRRYEVATPSARALLHAAMDARRLGAGPHLPRSFLEYAAADYLTNDEYDTLADHWLEEALAEIGAPVHGNLAPLRHIRPRSTHGISTSAEPDQPSYRLADYLEQHGHHQRRMLCPPASFWQAAHDCLTRPDSLANLAVAARRRHRTRWAYLLWHKAAEAGSSIALVQLAGMQETAGDHEAAERLARQAADAGNSWALYQLARGREAAGDYESAEALYHQARAAGNADAVQRLAELRERAGDREGAEEFARQAADAGNPGALLYLARDRQWADDHEGAELLYRQAADAGGALAFFRLAELREKNGDQEGAEALYQRAADAGDIDALLRLGRTREEAGDYNGAETLYQQAAKAEGTLALLRLAELREKNGDRKGAEQFARQAASAGDTDVLYRLARNREWTRDGEGAELLYRQAADAGDPDALLWLAGRLEKAGDHEDAQTLYRQAAEAGGSLALFRLAEQRERAGDQEGAAILYRQAAEAGGTLALLRLAREREDVGDHEGAERFARQAADAGNTEVMAWLTDLREKSGDREGAQRLYRQAGGIENPQVLASLAGLREKAGDREGAEQFARQAADAGDTSCLGWLAGVRRKAGAYDDGLWQYGLDPDGTPSAPWVPPH
ncbi:MULTISPECIES: tetratricopeptide repeat protein [Streptomyces]|uniref:tetratricopeptide repeat protein n=2 Tax=Streptomyces TaxID=1883 RepID=UPI00287FA85D|nr:helix-turn-helix domain-containing protein [Streptomyces sp. CGMCC 4.1456]WNF63504.1 helix-turn-helix domain-containing protein [Streptomyces sp. CGMCC 4.1456]